MGFYWSCGQCDWLSHWSCDQQTRKPWVLKASPGVCSSENSESYRKVNINQNVYGFAMAGFYCYLCTLTLKIFPQTSQAWDVRGNRQSKKKKKKTDEDLTFTKTEKRLDIDKFYLAEVVVSGVPSSLPISTNTQNLFPPFVKEWLVTQL